MDKLAPWSRGTVRAVIAAFLAWAVVMQGLAAAAPIRGGADRGGALLASVERCVANGGSNDHRNAPEHHLPCSCCISCRSGQLGRLAWIAAPPPAGMEPACPAAGAVLLGEPLLVEPTQPVGWIGSWSQWAPPAFS